MARAVRLIGDVCLLMIVIHLLTGAKRYGELLAGMDHTSSKTLTQRLKLLEDLHFVERRAFNEIPPRVEYQLTEEGRALGVIIAAIENFAQQYLPAEGAE